MNERYARMRHQRRIGRFLALLAILALSAFLFRSKVCVVREVIVEGNNVYSDDEIANFSGISLGDNLFQVREEEVRRNFSFNTIVEFVDLARSFPSTVILTVRERVPRAVVNCGGMLYVIDADGYILEQSNRMPDADVILVSGMSVSVVQSGSYLRAADTEQFALCFEILDAISDQRFESEISELNLENENNLFLVSGSGVQIILGDSLDLARKLTWAQTVLHVLTEEGTMSGVLDVSTGENAVYSDR